MLELEFHGAAETVTGSMHVLHLSDGPVALDCGLFQGRRAVARELNESRAVDPARLRSILLSHAHIDHCGRIPKLVKDGFEGSVYCTSATADLCDVMLADSAHIQEEDARFWNEKRASSPSEHIKPLYTSEDAAATVKHLRGMPYDQPIPFGEGCSVTFLEAGHILGSACLLVEITRSPTRRILFTGDLGRFDIPILRDPAEPLPPVDYLITESTYANRRHADSGRMKLELARIINETRQRGGKVIIPAFSLGRTQHVVYSILRAEAEGLTEPVPVYVDSPLSVNVTQVFEKHPECYDEQAWSFWQRNGEVFENGMVTYITEVADSIALNGRNEPCVIIASSGMCEAGRILHHLKNNIEDERNAVVIVGYQAQHTLGRRIVEREDRVKIFGRYYDMLAKVEVLNGFSAHADADDFRRLLAPLAPNLKAAFVVHGEGPQLTAMESILSGAGCREIIVPRPGSRYELD